MKNSFQKKPLSISSINLFKLSRIVITVILMASVILSAASPITPVSSKGLISESKSQLFETINLCTSPIINSDRTWTADNVYQAAGCVVTVNAGVTLTIEAGTVIQFGSGTSGMIISGELIANGNQTSPVVFTAANDNSDSGGNNTAYPGDWWGIVLRENSIATMDYVHIRYAGSDTCNHSFADPNYNSCYNRAQLDVRKADLSLNHSTIINGEATGLFLDGDGLEPSVQNTLFENNSSIDTNNRGAAIEQTTINMQPIYTNLTFSNNTRNQVVMPVGTLNRDVTLGGAPTGFTCGSNDCPIKPVSPYTLTMAAGAELDLAWSYPIYFLVGSGATLNIEGTSELPVTITNGSIQFEYGSHGQITHCDLSGSDGYLNGLLIKTDGVRVSDSTIHNMGRDGVRVSAGMNNSISTTFTNVNIIDNTEDGIYLETISGGELHFTMDGGAVSSNGWSGIKAANSAINLTLKNLLIEENGFSSTYWFDHQGIHLNAVRINPILENLTINNHPGAAIYWLCDGSITAKNITANGNLVGDELQLASCSVTAGREWDLADAGVPIHATETINVESGGILSITPGTSLEFNANKQLYIKSGGALYALGTADEPIIFTAHSGASSWLGIQNYMGTLILRHSEVSLAVKGLLLGASSTTPPTNSIIQNCKIHDNDTGIFAYAPTYATTSIVYNEIYDNSILGIDWGGFSTDAINAYYNYWGHPSGPYHATLNPDGLGNPVDDYVNFDPFLTAPPEDQSLVGDMWVSTAGPATISPGEVNDYAIQYLNLQAEPVSDAIAVIQLPLAGTYLSSTSGGTYWPARHQVFWVLGNINPGSQGMLTARVRFDWGLPGSYKDGSYTVLAGSNYQSEAINFDEYLNFDKDELEGTIRVEASTIPASPDFSALYNQAIADGFEFRGAHKNFFEGGKVSYLVTMRTPDKRTARFISLEEDGYASASTSDGSTYFSIQDVSGGQTTDLLTLESTLWGTWDDLQAVNSIMVECNYARCMRNCSLKKISVEMMKDAAKGAAVWLFGIPVFGGFAATAWAVYEAADMAHEIYLCHKGCDNNPLTGCCNAGEILWSPSTLMGNTSCSKYVCDASSLSFPPFPNSTNPCGYGYRCVAGYGNRGGCKPCVEDFILAMSMVGPEMNNASTCSSNSINGGKTKCSDLTIRVAKDPNAIYGPLGDVLPEQVMDYRITCENEGEGDAYGVYILNDLPEQLDEDTLVINDGGIYLPAERQIAWYIGELGPKGDPTSEAEVTYTAQLKPGLPIGTAVVNQATVYFPSVPEETPTNTWVNLIYPLAATPMQLETNYMTPLAITLAGRPAGSLTFNLESLPIGGTLEGELPNLTYTPVENFSGTDFFTFSISLDDETSQPAQVTINVSSDGDNTGPSVLWVMPEDQETDVEYSESPIRTIPEGDVYAPIIVAKLSEKVQEETISSSSVSVMESGGDVIPIKATFDPVTNLLTIQLLAPLNQRRTYTVSLTTEILDLNDNPLIQNYSWLFTVKEHGIGIFLPIILKQ